MIDHLLKQTCYLITRTRNSFGDYVEISRRATKCKFREISTLNRQERLEVKDSDAIAWFSCTTSVSLGSLVSFGGVTYQVERITKARNLYEDRVLFIKTDLKVLSHDFS